MALVNSKYLALINQTPAPTLDYEGGNPLETSGIEIPPTDEANTGPPEHGHILVPIENGGYVGNR